MARVELYWDPFDQTDPGPCIDVAIMNSRDAIEAGRAIGLEFPAARSMKALLDTGASVTVISKVFANYCKLFHTNEGGEITAIGAPTPAGNTPEPSVFPGLNCDHSIPFELFRSISCKSDFTHV
jgi:hypothetical protein